MQQLAFAPKDVPDEHEAPACDDEERPAVEGDDSDEPENRNPGEMDVDEANPF